MAAARKRKATTRKTTAKRSTAKKSTAKKSTARKTTAKRKTTARKSTARKTTAKRKTTAARSKPATNRGPVKVGKKPFTKGDLIRSICEQTELQRKDVVAVMESFSEIIGGHLAKNGPESFSWPGLFKMKVVKKPATKARKGINPFTGEEMMFKAKPASRKVKILPLKQLKEMAN